MFIGQRRRAKFGVIGRPAPVLPVAVCFLCLEMSSINEAAPCVGNETRGMVVSRVIDEERKVVIVCWLGETVEQLCIVWLVHMFSVIGVIHSNAHLCQ